MYSETSSIESSKKIITPLMQQNMQDPQSWISDMNSHELANQLNLRLVALAADRQEGADEHENNNARAGAAAYNPNDLDMMDEDGIEGQDGGHGIHLVTNEDEDEEVKGDDGPGGNDNVIEHAISSNDDQCVMITKASIRKLTPALQAPNATKCPSLTQFSFFDLTNDMHLAQLCDKLGKIQRDEDNRRPKLKHDSDIGGSS